MSGCVRNFAESVGASRCRAAVVRSPPTTASIVTAAAPSTTARNSRFMCQSSELAGTESLHRHDDKRERTGGGRRLCRPERCEDRQPPIPSRTAYCCGTGEQSPVPCGGAIMRTLLRTTCPAALALLLLQPTTGRADPIVISSGTIAGHVLLSSAQLDIQGSGFSFTGSLDGFLATTASCTPCMSPVADLSATFD